MQRFARRELAEGYDFYVKTQFEKNHGEEGENSLFSRGSSELSRVIICLQSLIPPLLLDGDRSV